MIVNLSKKKFLARAPLVADSLLPRARGMIGRKFDGSSFDAMVFNRCNCIHTLFMSIYIDVVFVDLDNKIRGLRRNLPPWTLMARCSAAFTTIELPAGVIEQTNTEVGDIINLSSEIVPELEKELKAKKIISSVESVVSFNESRK